MAIRHPSQRPKMNFRHLTCHTYSFLITYLFILLSFTSASSPLNEGEITYISGGKVLPTPQFALLNLKIHEVDFDQKGFSVPEVNALLGYLKLQSHAHQMNGFVGNDFGKYSLLLRFAESLKSESLFEIVARDFFYLLGTSVLDFMSIMPEVRSTVFEPILFRVYLDLSSHFDFETRVAIFSCLMNSVRPDFNSFEEFFTEFDYILLEANILKGSNITEWTLEIEGSLYTSFSIGNYESEEWHLKFVDGNPQFELAKFLVTNAEAARYSNLTTLFLALERRQSLPPEWKATAVKIARGFEFVDAIKLLLENGAQIRDQPADKFKKLSDSTPSNGKRKRDYDGDIGPDKKKRRIEETFSNSSNSFSDVKRFLLVFPGEHETTITVQKRCTRLWEHLREHFSSLKSRTGIMELKEQTVTITKRIKLPDLSWEAVKSYVEVTEQGLSIFNGPPNVPSYKLAKDIPTEKGEQKILMSQVAQMVCIAIRLEFDESLLFSLLDWYKRRMDGVWEELLEDGNKFVKEVEDFHDSIFVAQICSADDQS